MHVLGQVACVYLNETSMRMPQCMQGFDIYTAFKHVEFVLPSIHIYRIIAPSCQIGFGPQINVYTRRWNVCARFILNAKQTRSQSFKLGLDMEPPTAIIKARNTCKPHACAVQATMAEQVI